MQITCPNCAQSIDTAALTGPLSVTSCPGCGSELEVLDETRSLVSQGPHVHENYKLTQLLGSGHFGEVWKARDLRLDRWVAIKIPKAGRLDASSLRTFLREARSAAQIRHPHIVAVHDVVVQDGEPFIVSDIIEGVSLAERLKIESFPFRKAAELCATIAEALGHAHRAGVVHRDLKPANILMDREGRPHITDFGLAKRDGETMTMTAEGDILGTPAYMSPEQADGRAHEADGRSDIYSLGVTLYELLAGKRPFTGGSRLLLEQILHFDPPPLRRQDAKVPRDLETICLKAMAKAPAQRYQTAEEMADDLRRYLRDEPILARPVSQLEKRWRWCRRNPVLAGLGLAALVAVSVLGGLVWNARRLAATEEEARTEQARKTDEIIQAKASAEEKLRVIEQNISPPQRPRSVTMASLPAGARLHFIPLEPATGEVLVEKASALNSADTAAIQLAPGDYLVVAVLPSGDFHEVFRYVPFDDREVAQGVYPHRRFKLHEDGSVELAAVKIIESKTVTANMAQIPGVSHFAFGVDQDEHVRNMPAFWLDRTEVTVGAFRAGWSQHSALKAMTAPDDVPMTRINWDDAVAFAERVGKILPDEFMFEYAASQFGRSAFPWGDEPQAELSWELAAVGSRSFDRLAPDGSVMDLAGNALEWTSSWAQLFDTPLGRHNPLPMFRIVRGGPPSQTSSKASTDSAPYTARTRYGMGYLDAHSKLGFRCARSVEPRLEPADFSLPVKKGR